MAKLTHFRWFYPLILLLVTLFLAYRNYTPNTFLTGWDTLHPEFDFPLNFQRLIFGVWRSDQGLGDVAGHSAMADLPRVFILWLLHFILPLASLRYAYIFLCLILGPLGFYFLIKFLFINHKPARPAGGSYFINLVSFLSALSYLFNFGTLQQFYVPFEMFPTQWAFLPWIILFALRYFRQPSAFNLINFITFNLLATPAAYAAHLWYPFFGILVLFLLLFTKANRLPLKLPLILTVVTLTVNSFWLLPNLYYAATSSKIPQFHKGNRLHSQEFLERNRETGTISDTSLIKGFYFNWDSFDFKNFKSQKLMPQWQNHSSFFDIKLIGTLIFLFSLTGFIATLFQKNPSFLPFSPFFIIPFILLANNTPLFRNLFDYLTTIPLLSEIFRFVFTKMSILYTFGLNLFLAFFIHILFTVKTSPQFKKIFALVFSFSLLIYCYPYFQGQLISLLVRQKIPQNYLNLYTYSKNLPTGKTLTLPLHQSTGWQYYSWGYQGSGFIWFGLPFAILDRDSDRWSTQNEEAYREFNYALYSGNWQRFLLTLQKYQIRYLLWDTSNIATTPKNQSQITLTNETRSLLQNLIFQNQIRHLQSFGSISLFETNKLNDLLSAQKLYTNIYPPYSRHFSDEAFTGINYFSQNNSPTQVYPFRNLLLPTDRLDLNRFQVTSTPQGWILHHPESSSTIPLSLYHHLDQSTIDNQKLSSFNSTSGVQFDLPQMNHQTAYLIGIKSQYLKGIPLRLCLYNYYSNVCSFEDELSKFSTPNWDYFLIPPMDSFSGYELRLHAISYNFRPSQSEISQINIFSLDYSGLNLPLINQETAQSSPQPVKHQIIWPNFSLIKIIDPPAKTHLLFFQSYSPGWLAFYFDGLKPTFLQNHFLVNNWANGWALPDHSSPITVHILFWPQLLEFIGFALIPAAFLLILKHKSTF